MLLSVVGGVVSLPSLNSCVCLGHGASWDREALKLVLGLNEERSVGSRRRELFLDPSRVAPSTWFRPNLLTLTFTPNQASNK